VSPITRIAMQTRARAAAVDLVTDYAASAGVQLQVYPARPRSIAPPTAFVDRIRETLTEYTVATRQRVPTVEMIVLWGRLDDLEAVTQKDEFVDGFLDWVADRYHAIAPDTLVSVTRTEDIPNYIPDWLPPEQQRSYYATQISLEGFAAT